MEGNVYRYQGNEGEKVPKRTIEKLIVNPGIQILPDKLCMECKHLQEATLLEGLIKIGKLAFDECQSLLEIKIVCTVEFIGRAAFKDCHLLKKVEFESSTSSPHRL